MKQLQSIMFWCYRAGYIEDRAFRRMERVGAARKASVNPTNRMVFAKGCVNFNAPRSLSPFGRL